MRSLSFFDLTIHIVSYSSTLHFPPLAYPATTSWVSSNGPPVERLLQPVEGNDGLLQPPVGQIKLASGEATEQSVGFEDCKRRDMGYIPEEPRTTDTGTCDCPSIPSKIRDWPEMLPRSGKGGEHPPKGKRVCSFAFSVLFWRFCFRLLSLNGLYPVLRTLETVLPKACTVAQTVTSLAQPPA